MYEFFVVVVLQCSYDVSNSGIRTGPVCGTNTKESLTRSGASVWLEIYYVSQPPGRLGRLKRNKKTPTGSQHYYDSCHHENCLLVVSEGFIFEHKKLYNA